jgi:quercetin dioxygenase-like cupin family protein
MSDMSSQTPENEPIPPDDPSRTATIVRPDDPGLAHISLAGDTYTILLRGNDTAGLYTLVDMHVPPGGGPPPHRHDFEESFTVLAGEIRATFRGEAVTVGAGQTINIPANAPHSFANASAAPARLLCICVPAGQDEFFAEVGVPVQTRDAPPPQLDDSERAAMMGRARALAAQYKTELLGP